MSNITALLKMLSLSGGGPVGTAQEPWNPGAKFASGLPQSPSVQPNVPPVQSAAPAVSNSPQTFLGALGQAVAPQTYAALQEGRDQRGLLGDIGKAIAPQTYNALSGKGGGIG